DEEGVPVLGVEVDRVDVLVPLGRVLRVADGAVGAVPEPLRMLPHPGMVGAARDREVERALEPAAAGALDEGLEVADGPEVGVHGGVAALLGADRPWAADVAGSALGAVVRSLAE